MNDSLGTLPTATPPMPSDGAGSPPAGQNPLDALEQILQQAKANKGGGSDPQADAQAQLDAQKKQEEEARIQALIREKRQADALAMQQKMAELKGIKDTPQYQARLEQDQQKQDEQQATQQENDGYEIEQITHTKV